jgi:tRNA(adenine34) deaminase
MELSVFSDEHYMREALKEAGKAFEAGEVPVGAIIVCNNKIIARSYNMTERLTDVTAHAEMQAITAAANFLNGKYLNECTLYVTLEPCMMCAGAIFWAQLGKLVYGAADKKRGYHLLMNGNANMPDNAIKNIAENKPYSVLHPKTAVKNGVLEEECSSLIRKFFQQRR